MGLFNFDLDAIESYVAEHLRLFISMVFGLIIFVGIIAIAIFFIFIRGAEETMVPDVQGMDLTQALLELQVKELYPRIQLRYTQSSVDRGLILEQSPRPGSIVKAGRRIRLVVSQGALLNSVENYIGRNIDDVRMDLQVLFTTEGAFSIPLLSIREPVMYEFSSEPSGTILQQQPEAGTGISSPILIEFVVSRGSEDASLRLPDFIGLPMEAALDLISRLGIDFMFTMQGAEASEVPGTVIRQNPGADAMISSDTRVRFTVASPSDRSSDTVFNIFSYDIPVNPYPLPLRLEAQLPSGERRLLLALDYAGGELTVPYNLPLRSMLILSLLNREIYRETVMPAMEVLFLDQL